MIFLWVEFFPPPPPVQNTKKFVAQFLLEELLVGKKVKVIIHFWGIICWNTRELHMVQLIFII